MVDGSSRPTHDKPLDPKTDVLNDWAGPEPDPSPVIVIKPLISKAEIQTLVQNAVER